MATFSTLPDRLPDPTMLINASGVPDTTGTSPPGFASVSVANNRPVAASRTVSGRGIQVAQGSQHWEITINYHPMPRESFDTVASFLDFKNGKLNPFYVVLPQYSRPKDANFANFATSNQIRLAGVHAAGSSKILIDATNNFTGQARPGDFFTITDTTNANHKKAYKIVLVETNETYQAGQPQPATNQMRLHIMPPLTKATADNSLINFINPMFRVIQKSDVIEYNLNTDNLYSFQLQLEEINA